MTNFSNCAFDETPNGSSQLQRRVCCLFVSTTRPSQLRHKILHTFLIGFKQKSGSRVDVQYRQTNRLRSRGKVDCRD